MKIVSEKRLKERSSYFVSPRIVATFFRMLLVTLGVTSPEHRKCKIINVFHLIFEYCNSVIFVFYLNYVF